MNNKPQHEERHLKIYMDLTNKCNLRCRMCYFYLDLGKQEPITMDMALFTKIASEIFPFALSVNLSCAAEPLMLKDITSYLDEIPKYNIPQTLIVTNGVLLTEKIIHSLIKNSITILDVSIDGARKETYEKIRKGSDFDRLIKNIILLKRIKELTKSKTPLLHLDYALMKSNLDELLEFLKLAKELGANLVRVNHLIPFKKLDIMDESLIHEREKTNKILNEARKLADELSLNAVIPKDLPKPENAPKKPVFNKPDCKTPFESIYISSDGRTIPCIWFTMDEWFTGSLKDQTFSEIWNGPKYTHLRKAFKKGEYTPNCLNCPIYGDEDPSNYIFTELERSSVANISKKGV